MIPTLRTVFRLALRQTEGLIGSILQTAMFNKMTDEEIDEYLFGRSQCPIGK